MKIPEKLIIENASYSLDGGSIYLTVKDIDNISHQISLEKDFYSIEGSNYLSQLNRLYFDDILVPIRSGAEELILKSLRNAGVEKKNCDSCHSL